MGRFALLALLTAATEMSELAADVAALVPSLVRFRQAGLLGLLARAGVVAYERAVVSRAPGKGEPARRQAAHRAALARHPAIAQSVVCPVAAMKAGAARNDGRSNSDPMRLAANSPNRRRRVRS